ncbi:MAG: NAD(+) kinase [Euryarchaeota archaeon]|nr:NAD(+) kinase [Euryarchaeota archaeon]
MKFAVVANPERDDCITLAREVMERLSAEVEQKTAEKMGMKGTPIEELNADIIITIGGDGTILLALQRARGAVLGVNLGVLGFLSEIEPAHLWDAIERIENGDYIIDRRMKLAVWKNKERLYDCVNEVVIHTSEIAKLRNYRIHFNNECVDEIRSDGLIISTPTGSTSYALSAGGPVLYPALESIVIVPIAPFKAATRAFVVPTGELKIEMPDKKENVLVLDGQKSVNLKSEDVVFVKKSEFYAEFIRFDSKFFTKLKRRMLVR